MSEERLAACEVRLDAQFSWITSLFVIMLSKDLVRAAELQTTFDSVSTALQTHALETPELPDDQRHALDSHLAHLGKLRHHLGL